MQGLSAIYLFVLALDAGLSRSSPAYDVATVFGAIGFVLSFWAYKNWTFRPEGFDGDPREYWWTKDDYRADLIEHDSPPAGPLGDSEWMKIESRVVSEPGKVIEELEPKSRAKPRVIGYRLMLWQAQANLGHLNEAVREMRALLSLPLRDGTRASLLNCWLAHHLAAGDLEFVQAEVAGILDGSVSSKVAIAVLDQISSLCLMNPSCRRFMPEADEWSRRAILIHPDSLTLKGTRGSVLVELGRLAEGSLLLEEVIRLSAEPINVGIGSLYLAIVAKRQGDSDKAMVYSARARKIYPQPWLMERLKAEEL